MSPPEMALQQAPAVPAWRRPWTLALSGLALAVVADVLVNVDAPNLIPVRLAVIAAALILPGLALIQRFRHGVTDIEDRTEPACLAGLASLIAFLCSVAFDLQSEDSGVMLTRVLGVAALVGACLVALPSPLRKVLASLIILFHFGGILTAVTAVAPPRAQAPWLSIQAWGYVYHPYLQFMYLGNAYHFYSPEPGPPTLLWFRVKYQSGHSQWVKIPSRKNSPVPMYYMRRVAMSETFNDIDNVSPEQFALRLQARQAARDKKGKDIPLDPYRPATNQFVPLTDLSQSLMSSYVRHVAKSSPRAEDPSDPVVSIKAYRVTQSILTPDEVVREVSPIDMTTYLPIYCGEFDAQGKLLDPNDPLLYWLIPIYRDFQGGRPTDVVLNYFEYQSGDTNKPPKE